MRSNDRVEQNNSSLSAGSCLKGNTPGCYEHSPSGARAGPQTQRHSGIRDRFGVYDQVLTGNERAVSVAFFDVVNVDIM